VCVQSLRLDFNAIRQIDGLDACHLLRNLSLAHNQIKAVRNIGHLRNLESLNLSFNAIPTLDALRPLSGNRILWLFCFSS
jgi:Leucine-rich repeat (LRR) protein